MSLPEDVLDHIFSFLQFDFYALRACSQSDPRFIPLVERHFYANVTLGEQHIAITGSHHVEPAEFTSLLSDNPHIANYIRNLDVHLRVTEPVQHWLEIKASILRMCPLLNTVTFRSPNGPIKWLSLPENFRLALLSCLHLPSMKAVYIIRVSDFPLTDLKSCEGLKSLTLYDWTPGPSFTPETSRHSLEHLDIQFCSQEDVQEIITWVEPCNLHSLEIMFLASRNIEQLSRVFFSCSNTLTDLNLDIWRDFQSNYKFKLGHASTVDHPPKTMFLSLSSLLCLERFTICANLYFYHYPSRSLPDLFEFRSPIPWIACLLKGALPLQHLMLDFHFHLNDQLHIPHDSESLWFPLVSFISESSTPCINLRVKANKSRYLGDESMTAHVLSSFSRCTNLMQMVEQGLLVTTPAIPKPLLLNEAEGAAQCVD